MWLRQIIRRTGRIGIGFLSFAVGCLVWGAALLFNIWAIEHSQSFSIAHFWQIWLFSGLVAPVLAFTLFDRLGLVPEDDWDRPTTLLLRDEPIDPADPLARVRSGVDRTLRPRQRVASPTRRR